VKEMDDEIKLSFRVLHRVLDVYKKEGCIDGDEFENTFETLNNAEKFMLEVDEGYDAKHGNEGTTNDSDNPKGFENESDSDLF
jgi:hypothetical protein